MVVLNFNVAGSASTGTGNMIIGGLPFACGSVISIGSILYVTGPTFPTLTTSAIVQLGSGNSTMAVVAQGATTIGNVQMSNTAFSIQGTIAYVSAS
jgi:hypothetical protein